MYKTTDRKEMITRRKKTSRFGGFCYNLRIKLASAPAFSKKLAVKRDLF